MAGPGDPGDYGGPGDPRQNFGSNYFGLKSSVDFNPGVIAGDPKDRAVYEDGYNPWIKDNDPANDAMMGQFEARFEANSAEALQEYAELSQKKYGYTFHTAGQGATKTTLRGTKDRAAGDYIRVTTKAQGLTGKGAFEGSTRFITADAYTQSGQADLHKKGGQKLTDAEEYMLFRYQRRDEVGLDEVGTEETEYNYTIDEGGSFADKTSLQKKGIGSAVQIGANKTNRVDRAAGKSKFKAAQL